jgi:hypothetical protein
MLHLEILDQKRQDLLPLIAKAGEGFYLAGGTALALQYGHRDSIDFDFFINDNFSTPDLWSKLETIFSGHALLKTQEEENTLSIIIDDVRISFFGYHYNLINTPREESGFILATPLEIGCMKLSAITGRSTLKDYVDLYFILKNHSLSELLIAAKQKYPSLDQALILKSLTYFDDIDEEPIRFMPDFVVTKTEIFAFLADTVKNYWLNDRG